MNRGGDLSFRQSSRTPRKILFVFAWLVVGGEETEFRLLVKNLDPARWRLEAVACFRLPNMPDQTHRQLADLGVPVDTTPYDLSFDERVAYLARRMAGFDLIVACQAVAEVYPALELMERRPPLIEHGGLVSEALAGPKHFTTRYVGVCASIQDAAASRMREVPHHALLIPSMVDLSEFDSQARPAVRREWGWPEDLVVIGWVGRLDRKKRVEDFISAAALAGENHLRARFVIIGGPDAFMPDYAGELRAQAEGLGLSDVLRFLGDRPDVPRLLAGLDVFVWLSRGEGMPHVIAEAGAAGLPVIATRDNGSEEQITEGMTGLFVPHQDPTAVAGAMARLIAEPDLRRRLGAALRQKVERDYSVAAIVPRWEALFEELCLSCRHDEGA